MLAVITRAERVRGGHDQLRVVAHHGLPRGFTATLDGVALVDGSSISGTAAFRREPLVVADIADPDAGLSPWYVDLAMSHGVRAGWATPILSRTGAVLGTFTIYYRTNRTPDERDRTVIDRSVHLARLAIEQIDGAEALRRNATRAQSLAREQTALQRVATQVAGETDPEILFSLVAEQVARLLKAEAGYVMRFEDEDRYRNMGSWARDEERLLPPDAVAKHLPDGICAMLRRCRSARRCAWGMVCALRDATEFRREDEKRLVRFAQLASVAVAVAYSLARRHGVTLSAGVAALVTGQSADDLLRCADQALYGAKDQGRNQVVSYDADMPGRGGLRLSA